MKNKKKKKENWQYKIKQKKIQKSIKIKKKSPKRALFAEMFSSFSVEPQLQAIGDIVHFL